MVEIVNVKSYSGGIERATRYFHSQWEDNEDNFPFYYDCFLHSSEKGKPLPKFYLLLKQKTIIGCYGLIINDMISRHDLFPWLSHLFIERDERENSYGKLLLDHAGQEATRAGFSTLCLQNDHDGLYENFGWQRIDDGFEADGSKTRIYMKKFV